MIIGLDANMDPRHMTTPTKRPPIDDKGTYTLVQDKYGGWVVQIEATNPPLDPKHIDKWEVERRKTEEDEEMAE